MHACASMRTFVCVGMRACAWVRATCGHLSIFSSTVPGVIKRMTSVCFVCPIRLIRAFAYREAGYQLIIVLFLLPLLSTSRCCVPE